MVGGLIALPAEAAVEEHWVSRSATVRMASRTDGSARMTRLTGDDRGVPMAGEDAGAGRRYQRMPAMRVAWRLCAADGKISRQICTPSAKDATEGHQDEEADRSEQICG